MIHRKDKFFGSLFLIIFLITCMPHIVGAADNKIGDDRVLQSASELDYPPFAIVGPEGQADGFSVDLLKAVCKTMGLQINFTVGPWNELKQQLAQGQLDVLPLVSWSEQRDQIYDFTAPYLRMHGTIFVRKGNRSIRTKADLKDKEVLVMRGDTAHEYAVQERLSDHLILTDNYGQALQMLSNGKHDAVIIQHLVGLNLIKQLGLSNLVSIDTFSETDLRPTEKPLSGFEQKFCIAVHEGDKKLLSLLNEGLAMIIANGTYNALYNKWFEAILPTPPVPLKEILKYLLFAMVPVFFFASLLGFWWLKQEIQRKTQTLHNEIVGRKKIEATLRASEKKFQIIFDTVHSGIVLFSESGVITFANRRMADILDENLDSVIGTPYMNYIHDPQLPDTESEFFQQMLNRQGRTDEVNYKRKNGTFFWGLVTLNQLLDPDGKLQNMVGVIYDFTEQKNAKDALMQSEKRYRTYIDHSPMGIFITDAAGNYVDVNPAACELLGYDKQELLRLSIEKIDQTPNVVDDFKTLKRKGYLHSENFLLHKTGKIIHVRLEAVTLEENRYMAFCSDLSEQDRLTKALQHSRKMEAIGTLAGGIAHNFNNILSAIFGFTELSLEDADPDSMLHENLQEVLSAAKRARDLVKQMLSFAKQSNESVEAIHIAEIVEEALKLIASWIPATVTLRQNIDCKSMVLGNAAQLHQILIHLCTNAVDAMGKIGGSLTLSLNEAVVEPSLNDMGRQIDPGSYVKLSVSDTGPGIAPAILGSIFDPYFTTKDTDKGTGMGLAMVHGIVESYGGRIVVDTKLSKGSTFSIYLPVAENEFPLPAENEIKTLNKGTGNILFVDDDVSIVKMQQRMLERMGYKVTAFTDSRDALAFFRSMPDHFDLVITDMTMPEMTGDRLAAEIKKIRSALPIILCTGFSEKISIQTGENLQIDGFLMKPADQVQMHTMIHKLMAH